jgi:hypothetical protein
MKVIHQLLLFVTTLSFAQHSKHVEGQLLNFGIVDKITNPIHTVLNVILPWQSAPSQSNATTYFPMDQTSQHVVPTYIPISSEDVQQQEVSTLPQDSVNDTVQNVQEGRAVIDAPLINRKCKDGYQAVNGRCREVFGRRRRRR